MGKDMLSYEILDTIADSVNPTLLVVALIVIGMTMASRRWRLAGMQILSMFAGLFVAYGFMMADNKLKIWPAFGLDYSTHTAVAIVLVAFLTIYVKKLTPIWLGILSAYIVLILYHRYHSLADILATALVVTAPIVLAMWFLRSRAESADAR
jgi:hypothetical protein